MTDQREALLADIARELPPIVFRNWKRWRDIIPMAPRTVANEDSLGKGPKEFVYVGRVKGYPKEAFIDYLAIRSSRGKCLCQSLYQCHDCAGYVPCNDNLVPARCVNLDPADCVTCHFKEKKSCCA